MSLLASIHVSRHVLADGAASRASLDLGHAALLLCFLLPRGLPADIRLYLGRRTALIQVAAARLPADVCLNLRRCGVRLLRLPGPNPGWISKRHTRCQRGETVGRREGSVGCLNVGDPRQLLFGGLLGAPKPGRANSARRPRCHQQLTALVDPGLHSGVDRITQSLVP